MVTLLRAPNPSPMTLDGTNGYVIAAGGGELIAIDPGIDDPAHIASFVRHAAQAHARYAAILVTHGHPDHFPGALALRRLTGAPIYAHPSAVFGYDRPIDEGAELRFAAATIRVLYAPGHTPDHLVFWLPERRALFSGDVVIGTGTVVIAPPAGNMRHYQATLERLLGDYGDADIIYGGHGPAIASVRAKLTAYIAHRREREAQVVAALSAGPATIPALVGAIYADVDAALWPVAGRQVLAYLEALEREGRVVSSMMARRPNAHEAAILHPDFAALVRGVDPAVARAELGLSTGSEPFLRFALAD